MGTSRNRLVTLAALIGILAALVWWQSGSNPTSVAPSGATAPKGGQPGASARSGGAERTVPVVALARLSREAPEPSDTGRDPFRFSARGAGSGRSSTGMVPPVAPAPSPVALPVESTGPPPPPPIPLKFIAVVSRRAGVKIAMLTDGRGVYYGSEGSVIEGQYRIVRIGLDSIEMTYLDGRGRRTIPLSGS